MYCRCTGRPSDTELSEPPSLKQRKETITSLQTDIIIIIIITANQTDFFHCTTSLHK